MIKNSFKGSRIKIKKIAKINYKMSNMKMIIYPIILKNIFTSSNEYLWVEEKKLTRYTLSVFTKKIIKYIDEYEL